MNPPKYIHFLLAAQKRRGVSLKGRKLLPTMPSPDCFPESLLIRRRCGRKRRPSWTCGRGF